jgi:hypothetical protein
MNAEVSYDLYEEPVRWSRALLISCIVALALLALWIVVPPALRHFAPAAFATRHKAVLHTPLLDQSARKVAAMGNAAPSNSVRSVRYEATPADTSASVTTLESTQSAIPDAPGSQLSVVREASVASAPASATTTVGQLAQLAPPPVWAPIQRSWPPPASAFEEDAEPIARPPLPRARPHELTLAGGLGIPLPHPRPFIATETTGSVPETDPGRPDFF